jgi:pimeloyl-ACP methyl ester carboxylesterase
MASSSEDGAGAGPGTRGTFQAKDGWSLAYECWEGQASPTSLPTSSRGLALFLHGVHASADTVQVRRLAQAFTDRGVTFYALEHHGHGGSLNKGSQLRPGVKGLIEGWATLRRHALEFGCHVAEDPDTSLFVLGHSMGGATALLAAGELHAALGDRFKGLVLIAPALVLKKPPSLLIATALRGLSLVGLGWLALGPADDTAVYTPHASEPAGVGRNYAGGMRVGTASCLVSFSSVSLRPLPPRLRVLLVTGDCDEVVDVAGVTHCLSSLHSQREGKGQGKGQGELVCWHLAGKGHSPLGELGGNAVATCRQIVSFCVA